MVDDHKAMVSARIDKVTDEQLKEYAEYRGVSTSCAINELLRERLQIRHSEAEVLLPEDLEKLDELEELLSKSHLLIMLIKSVKSAKSVYRRLF